MKNLAAHINEAMTSSVNEQSSRATVTDFNYRTYNISKDVVNAMTKELSKSTVMPMYTKTTDNKYIGISILFSSSFKKNDVNYVTKKLEAAFNAAGVKSYDKYFVEAYTTSSKIIVVFDANIEKEIT